MFLGSKKLSLAMLTTTTANLCEAQLLNSLNIYVGTHIGSFKGKDIKHTKVGLMQIMKF